MDPFSATASGFAVVSLAIQLVDSVREIKRFLRNVSEAPKELKRLLHLLEQLELILENIGAQMAKQQKNSGESDDGTITSVQKAMKMCESELLNLEIFVQKAKKASEAGNKVTRTVGAFKLACKKKEVEEFEGQLQRAINLLDVTMTINSNLLRAQSTDLILTDLAFLKSSVFMIKSDPSKFANSLARQSHTRLNGTLISQRQSASIFWYKSPFGRFIIRQKSQYTDFGGKGDEELETSSQTSWVFVPSFFSRCLIFRSVNKMGSIERSFRTWPVIPQDHPVWDICRNGNIIEFQTLLSSRAISPFSVDQFGWTLLHRGACSFQFEICKLLLELGLTGEEEAHNGELPIENIRLGFGESASLQTINNTLHLLVSRLSTTELPLGEFFLDCISDVRRLNFALDEWITPQNIQNLCLPLYWSVRAMWEQWSAESDSHSLDNWKMAIGRLINIGADPHDARIYSKSTMTTFLDDIIRIGHHVLDSRAIIQEWFDILRRAGVDVVEYLRVEIEIHGGESYSFNSGPRGILHVELAIGDNQEVTCDLCFDPESNAFNVLHEFRYYGPWMHHTFEVDDENYNWPYCYPKWIFNSYGNPWVNLADGTYGPDPAAGPTARLVKERFERRAYKKAMKLARIQGIIHKGPKIPGAWID